MDRPFNQISTTPHQSYSNLSAFLVALYPIITSQHQYKPKSNTDRGSFLLSLVVLKVRNVYFNPEIDILNLKDLTHPKASSRGGRITYGPQKGACYPLSQVDVRFNTRLMPRTMLERDSFMESPVSIRGSNTKLNLS